MAVLLSGATGYIGSYVLAELLRRCDERVIVLARDASPERLWRALQLHLDESAFRDVLAERIEPVAGDLTRPGLGLAPADRDAIAARTGSIVHCAASLNRRSERACLNVNLRGTLEMLQLARRAVERGGLDRFSFVSTVAVAGERHREIVREDEAIDWDRRDYDPYARTKKFCEFMVHRLLPDVRRLVFRPSVVLGDSRRPETTQFDMVEAFAFLARRRFLPLSAGARIDIVPADWVGAAIAGLHLDPAPEHATYHLSAGEASPTYREITGALAAVRDGPPPRCWPWLEPVYRYSAAALARLARGRPAGRAAARLLVFLPYLTFDTVFDNRRAVAAAGTPRPFPEYCTELLRWSVEHRFRYPYREACPA